MYSEATGSLCNQFPSQIGFRLGGEEGGGKKERKKGEKGRERGGKGVEIGRKGKRYCGKETVGGWGREGCRNEGKKVEKIESGREGDRWMKRTDCQSSRMKFL